jgi:hypothetical protein
MVLNLAGMNIYGQSGNDKMVEESKKNTKNITDNHDKNTRITIDHMSQIKEEMTRVSKCQNIIKRVGYVILVCTLFTTIHSVYLILH